MKRPYYGANPIEFYRRQARLTPKQAAALAGMTLEYLVDVESGKGRRWTVRLHPLAAVLGVAVEDIAIQ